jgi:hypothetical protein
MTESTAPLPAGISSQHVMEGECYCWFRLYCFGCGHFFAWAAGHGETLPKNCPGCANIAAGVLDSRREGQHDPT